MRSENSELEPGQVRLFADAHASIEPGQHSATTQQGPPPPDRDDTQTHAALTQGVRGGESPFIEGQGSISSGVSRRTESSMPGAFDDGHEGQPLIQHHEETQEPRRHVLPQAQGSAQPAGPALISHASQTRSHTDVSPVEPRSQARGTLASSPGLPAVVSSPANAPGPYSADLERAHRRIAELERDKRELQAQRMTAADSTPARELAACRSELAQTRREQQTAVDALVRERDAAAAARLAVGAFDATLDRVSEGALRERVEALNSAIDDLVMDMLDGTKAAPLDATLVAKPAFAADDSPLLHVTQDLPPGDDMREYAIDAFLHVLIVRRLWDMFFSGKVAVKINGAEIVNHLYARVAAAEDWKVSQRWRAVTAGAISSSMAAAVAGKPFQDAAARTAKVIIGLLASGLCRQPAQLQSLHRTLVIRLGRIYEDAFRVANTSRRDVVSVHAMLVLAPSMSDLDPARVEVQWAEMGGRPTDKVHGTYAFGLRTKAEDGGRTLLLRPKVVTQGLTRYVWSCQGSKK